MAMVDKKKLGALVDKNAKKGQPPKKPGGGKNAKHYEEEAEHEGETAEEEGAEHEGDEDDIDVHEIGERVQNGDGDEHLMELSADVDEDHNPPASITDEETWNKAKKAVEPYWDNYDEPYAVVMHVYEAMGGEFK